MWKEGIHANQISKACIHVMSNEFENENEI